MLVFSPKETMDLEMILMEVLCPVCDFSKFLVILLLIDILHDRVDSLL